MEPPSASRIRNSTLAIAAALAVHAAAHAQSDVSDLSEASLVPVAISVALPVVLVVGVGSIVQHSGRASRSDLISADERPRAHGICRQLGCPYYNWTRARYGRNRNPGETKACHGEN